MDNHNFRDLKDIAEAINILAKHHSTLDRPSTAAERMSILMGHINARCEMMLRRIVYDERDCRYNKPLHTEER